MKPLHQLARGRQRSVTVVLAAALERSPAFARECRLAGAESLLELARQAERQSHRADAEAVESWFLAVTLAATAEASDRVKRTSRPTRSSIHLRLATARAALARGDDGAFLAWLEASETEVERARNARRISATEADDWGDRAYLLLGWLARRIGHDEQVQDVLDAFAEPPPSTHSLTTQAWVLHFQGMVAADRGDVRGARALLRQALERVPNVALSIEIELFHDYIEVLVQNGRRAYAAERLAELVLEARFAWPLADLLRIGFRAVELLSAAGRTGPARELLDLLATQTRPDDAPALYFTRAQLCLHGGAYRAAQALFEYLRASEPRSTEFAVRAALGLAQLAALDGSHQDAKAWARSIQEDLLHLSPDLPRRRGLEAALASLDAAVDDELPQALADADAWLVVSRHAPARPFQRPFPGARPVVPRAIDDEVSDFGNPGGGTATVH